MSSLRMLPLLLLPVLVLAGAAPAASAATVPGDVALYIANDLVDDLNEFYGPGTERTGREFTDTTTTSPGVRVFEFTPDFLAGVEADPPVRRLNEWVSVISVDKAPIGFAIVLVDPLTTLPQLKSFTESGDFGEVVLALPETATLVRDTDRSAWFTLDGAELTPIVTGTSEVSRPISVDDYRELVADQLKAQLDAEPEPADYGGLIIAGLILVLIILLLAVEAFLPRWHRRLRGRHEGEPVDEAEAGLEPEVEAPPAEVKKVPAKPRGPRSKPTASN